MTQINIFSFSTIKWQLRQKCEQCLNSFASLLAPQRPWKERTLEEVVFLNDKDIDSLDKRFWCPGGVIAVPTISGGAAQGNLGPLADSPVHSVSIRAETNLELAVFYLRHEAHISRILAPASVALTVVRSLRSTKEYEENFKVTAEHPVINDKD
jgi:hypothetical protein